MLLSNLVIVGPVTYSLAVDATVCIVAGLSRVTAGVVTVVVVTVNVRPVLISDNIAVSVSV